MIIYFLLIIYSSKPTTSGPSRALKLGSKKKDVDTFVGQLQSEGESEWLPAYVLFVPTF